MNITNTPVMNHEQSSPLMKKYKFLVEAFVLPLTHLFHTCIFRDSIFMLKITQLAQHLGKVKDNENC